MRKFRGDHDGFPQRKKKGPKKKEKFGRGDLLKLPQLRKSREKEAFGDFFLMDFHKLLEKSLRTKRSGFFTVTTGPTTINFNSWSFNLFSLSH